MQADRMYRPLSPHISIYKSQINSILSILHRFSGMYTALSVLCFIWTWKLVFYFINFHFLYLLTFYMNTFWAWATIIPLTLIFMASICLHILGGLRHLVWDFGFFLNKKSINFIGYASLLSVFALLFLLVC